MKNSIRNLWNSIFALLMILFCGVGAKASTPWTVNPSDYQYDMSIYLNVSFANANMDYSRYDIGVFVGDQCRGVSEVIPLGQDKECLYIRARSNQESGESLTFKYYDKQADKTNPIDGESINFVSNTRVGTPSIPHQIVIHRYFDVTISAETGGSIDKQSGRYKEGEVLVITATPDEGHHFSQWSDGVTDNPRSLTVDQDITLSAQFGINKYKLTYKVDGADYKSYDVEFGSKITPEAYPTKEGHSFSGWANLPETMPAHDVTASGSFSINSYNATFKIGEQIIETKSIVFGAAVVAPDAPAKEGHTFAGWKDVPATMPARDIEILGSYNVNKYKLTYKVDGADYKSYDVEFGSKITPEAYPTKEGHSFSGWANLPETMPAHDVTASGSFSINSYNATFKIGEQIIETKSIVFGAAVVAPEAPEKEGHTFAGWKDVPETMPARDIVILGSYNVNKYKLTYKVDGADYKSYDVEFGSEITPEAYPTKEGHSFSGWANLPETMPAHDVTASGSFSINSYNATFKIGEQIIETKSIVFGAAVVAPDAPAKEGHTFAGWKDVPATMPARDIEILGSYNVNKYKLTYKVDGADYKSYDVEFGSEITPEAYPTKEGHSFSGWANLPETMPAHDVTASGSFSINSYNATFKIGEQIIETKSIVFGAAVVAPDAPEKEGHTFAGWKDVPETMPARDIVILGSYNVNKYKLTYKVDGADYKSYDVEFGSKITPEAYPTKEGHSFSGWANLPDTMPAHDVTASGSFSINSYNATFKIGEQIIETKSIVFGDAVVAPDAPEKEGHTFAGWQNVPETMPARDIEILGSYNVNKYKLTYKVDGADYKSYDVEFGSKITPEAYPTKEGHSFSGWANLPETMPAHDVTASGSFSINSYQLSIYLNDDIYSQTMVEFGAPIVIEQPTIPEDMKFDGWLDEIPATMPAHDVDIHGTYSPKHNSIELIGINDDMIVTVTDINGRTILKEKSWQEVKFRLVKGLYIINGAKYLIN